MKARDAPQIVEDARFDGFAHEVDRIGSSHLGRPLGFEDGHRR